MTVAVFGDDMAAPEKYDGIDFKPPKAVAEAAEKGLEYRKKANPSDKGGLTPAEAGEQGIGSGVQRATNLKNRNECSPEVIRQMCAFFARHEKNKGIKPENRDTPWKQKGHVAWLLWGGDPGKTWAEKVRDQMDRADEKADKTAMLNRVAITYEKRRELEREYWEDQRRYKAPTSDAALERLADVADLLRDSKGASFLRQMSQSRYSPTEKQVAYLNILKKKYEPKLPMLDELREKAKSDREEAEKARLEVERQKAQEEKELADLGRQVGRQGWVEGRGWEDMGFTYEAAPYAAKISPNVDNYDIVTDWILRVRKDDKEIFYRVYPASRGRQAEVAEDVIAAAMGIIERDKRQSERSAPAPTPAAPSMSSGDRNEMLDKVKRLSEAAVAASDEWVANFTKSIAFQLSKGKTLSEKQVAVLDKNFKKYRVASQGCTCGATCRCMIARVASRFLRAKGL